MISTTKQIIEEHKHLCVIPDRLLTEKGLKEKHGEWVLLESLKKNMEKWNKFIDEQLPNVKGEKLAYYVGKKSLLQDFSDLLINHSPESFTSKDTEEDTKQIFPCLNTPSSSVQNPNLMCPKCHVNNKFCECVKKKCTCKKPIKAVGVSGTWCSRCGGRL